MVFKKGDNLLLCSGGVTVERRECGGHLRARSDGPLWSGGRPQSHWQKYRSDTFMIQDSIFLLKCGFSFYTYYLGTGNKGKRCRNWQKIL